MQENLELPRHYHPWPHQVSAWERRDSGLFTYYFKLWARQLGKDTDDIQHCTTSAWENPGTQSAYIGLDNVWIRNNIFKKYLDGRTHWDTFAAELIEVKDTEKEILLRNETGDKARSRVKFIGFLNDQGLIGSSYDRFYISEASLYRKGAFEYIRPIWDRKLAMGLPLSVNFNGTPRGMHNVLYDLLRVYTGEDDPDLFPGAHGDTYVDKVTIEDVLVPDGNGGFKKLYTPEEIERLAGHYLREFGNLNLFRQENYCDFTVVNAGLVYQGIEQLEKDGRYCDMNLDPSRPVYVAFDISSKDKVTDATSAIVYQYYNNRFIAYDIYEARGKALAECVQELTQKEYFHLIRFGVLPWDSERSASMETPIDEVRRMFPNINWHALDKERVDRGIAQVRKMLPNMVINKRLCGWLMECFQNYEYKRLTKADDWAAKPMHNQYSHMMDAMRYAVMGVNEMDYLKLNNDGSEHLEYGEYGGFWDDGPEYEKTNLPITWRKPKKNKEQSYGV